MTQNEQTQAAATEPHKPTRPPAAAWRLDTEASSPSTRVETLNGVQRETNLEVVSLTTPAEQSA